MTYKKKLIEVALPLDAINRETAREKSIRHGHPSTLHLWWARRPLGAARAVLWASVVDDPSSRPDRFPTEEQQELERARLFRILEELVKWENSTNWPLLAEAYSEILDSTDGSPPTIVDPFCGGGTIPLEAQRLGFETIAGDLNPVAVLISKAMVEIPPKFSGRRPVNPESGSQADLRTWDRAQGLADDVRYYGQWMRTRALESIGYLYPKIRLPKEQGGGEATVIAWIWARTVASPDPSWSGQVPLARSWLLRKPARGKPAVWIQPSVDRSNQSITYRIREGGEAPAGTVSRSRTTCLATGTAISRDYIKSEAVAGRMGAHLMAAIVETSNGRAYVPAQDVAVVDRPDGPPGKLAYDPRNIWCVDYGLTEWGDLFTDRQLVALNTFSELLLEAHALVKEHAVTTGMTENAANLAGRGDGAVAYADAVATYLAFVIDKCADYWSTICSWHTRGYIRNTFARQAIPMTWDYAETNPFSSSTGNWLAMVEWVSKVIEELPASGTGRVEQRDAASLVKEQTAPCIATDPPYYDNISYADLSDFFYVWLRQNLRSIWRDELSTLLTPKSEELIANPYRAGSREAAKNHFEDGMAAVFEQVAATQHQEYPATVFYAFKQAESDDGGTASTGWETFLQGLISGGFRVTATWPMRTEMINRSIATGTAALASSIVIAVRSRPDGAPLATRSEFFARLRSSLPQAVRLLQQQSIAPVDMAQSAIGPGMAEFSRYSKIVEADGSAMTVRQALALINEVLQETLSAEETEFDGDTRWALTWFEQHGLNPGPFGDAETLSKAKNTSVEGVIRAGIAVQRQGQVRLLDRSELPAEWDPAEDSRLTVWEVAQHLITRLGQSELEAARLLRRVGAGIGERSRQLAYLLYEAADRRGWAEEAVAYNSLVQIWPDLVRVSSGLERPAQRTLGE